MTRTCRRGDVLYVGVATTDGKRVVPRPAVVVQDPSLQTAFPNLIVAAVTSRTDRRGPGRIFVPRGTPEAEEMGLQVDSLITLDNLATVGRWAVLDVRGHCPLMAEVDEALRTDLGLHRTGPPSWEGAPRR